MSEGGLDPVYEIEMDLRGETLIYREPARGRRTSVICSFGARPILSPRTLEDWWHPETRQSMALIGPERAALVARIALHARSRLGLSALDIED